MNQLIQHPVEASSFVVFPYALPNPQELNAEGLAMTMGLGLLLGMGYGLYQLLERLGHLVNRYAVMGFRTHWSLEDVHSGVEADYHALEKAFQVYFQANPATPASLVRRLIFLLVVEALKGNLRFSSSLIGHLRQLTTRLEDSSPTGTDSHAVTPLAYASHLPCPYSWVSALPEADVTLLQPAPNDKNPTMAGVCLPASHKSRQQKGEKAIALILAEILVFAHEG